MSGKPYMEKRRSISTSSFCMFEKEDAEQGPIMDFDFSSMISELNLAIQEKEASLLAAAEENAELEMRLRESEIGRENLIEQGERLHMQLEEKTTSLQLSMRENELLRENLYELQTRANALEDATIQKNASLEQLEANLHLYQEESEALKRSREVTCSLIEKAEQDKLLLSEEVESTKRMSFYNQQESAKLSAKLGEDLRKSQRKLKSLSKTNKRLELEAEEAQKHRHSYMEENMQMQEQISTLRSIVENKTFELIDAQRELASLREQIDKGWQENQAFGILQQIEDVDLERRHTNVTNVSNLSGEVEPTEKTSDNEIDYVETARRNSIGEIAPGEPESIENNNLLFMLHQSEDYEEPGLTEGPSDDNRSESHDLEMENDEEMGWQESADDNKQNEVDMPIISTSKNDAITANKQMLVVFLYLTAAAVKLQYSDVDIKTAELIHLGQDMAFWELYPFFESVIKTLKAKDAGVEMKNATMEQNNEGLGKERKSKSKISAWFKRNERKWPGIQLFKK